MASISINTRGSCSAGKSASPVAKEIPAGQQSDGSNPIIERETVAAQETQELHNQVIQLQKEIEELHKQLQTAKLGNYQPPGYNQIPEQQRLFAIRDKQSLLAARDRTLNKLKMGRQSTVGKAIDANSIGNTYTKEIA